MSSAKNQTALTTHFDEKAFLASWTKSKKELRETHDRITNYMKENTAKEQKGVEDAMNKLNKKIQTLSTSDNYKKLEKQYMDSENKLQSHLSKAIKFFEEQKKVIMSDKQKGGSEKEKDVKRLQNYILSKMYTPEEIDAFNNYLFVTVVDSRRAIKGSD
jgi:cell pole-organizing protein PopZ